jgi:hypothetical protein
LELDPEAGSKVLRLQQKLNRWISDMEKALQRRRPGREPDEVKASRPVRETVGGDGTQMGHRAPY